MKDDLPSTCKFIVPNPNELHNLELWITPPRESMWYGGRFKFVIDIPLEYKYAVIFATVFSCFLNLIGFSFEFSHQKYVV